MHILHVITELGIGGAQDNTLLSVELLDRKKYVVDVAGAPGGEWVCRAHDVADRVHLISSLKRNIHPVNDIKAIFDIYRLLRRHKYDIVHTHSSKAGLVGRIAARLARVPFVIHTVHGFPFNDQTFPYWMRQLYLFLEKFGARLSDRLVMVADLNRREALQKGVASADKMVVVYSGLDLSRFDHVPDKGTAKQRLGIDPATRVIGTVGRISACNAPLVFIDAAKNLLDRYNDLQVIIIGDGELRSEVENAIGGESRIRLLGFRQDIPDLLPAMDVFLFPNLWGGLGRSVTEALAVGLPVVAFPVNGVPELVENHVTGLHATVGDAQDLARKTAILLETPDLATRLGHAGQKRVYSTFSAQKMAKDLDHLYTRLKQDQRFRQ